MIFSPPTSCQRCIHYKHNDTCAAFIDGIPKPILDGDVLHDKPYPNDQGILFSPKKFPPLYWDA